MGEELTTLLESAKGMKEMSWIGEESNGARAPSPKAPKRKMKTKQTKQGKIWDWRQTQLPVLKHIELRSLGYVHA